MALLPLTTWHLPHHGQCVSAALQNWSLSFTHQQPQQQKLDLHPHFYDTLNYGHEIPLSHFINAPGIYRELMQSILFDYDVIIAPMNVNPMQIGLSGGCGLAIPINRVHSVSVSPNYDWSTDRGTTYTSHECCSLTNAERDTNSVGGSAW